MRPTNVVGPILFSSTGAATIIVRTWAMVNPRATVAAVADKIQKMLRYRPMVRRKDAATTAHTARTDKPSHAGGSDGNPK